MRLQSQNQVDGELHSFALRGHYHTNPTLPSRFLLKYASRDEVELHGKGNGGIVEIRNAIAQLEEPEPLFGFLLYRRRNVVIKYIPEECSRLVQGKHPPSLRKTHFCELYADLLT
jgi:hypothetical protein